MAWVARNKLGHWSGLSQGKRLACTGLGLGSGLLPDFLGCEAGTGDDASISVSGSLFGSDLIDPRWSRGSLPHPVLLSSIGHVSCR